MTAARVRAPPTNLLSLSIARSLVSLALRIALLGFWLCTALKLRSSYRHMPMCLLHSGYTYLILTRIARQPGKSQCLRLETSGRATSHPTCANHV